MLHRVIESVARALPKTRASGVELAQKIASTTPEFVAKFPRMDHAFGARRANFAFSFPTIPFCKSQAVGVAPTRVGTLLSAEKARVRRGDCAIFSPENAQVRLQIFRSSTRNAPNLYVHKNVDFCQRFTFGTFRTFGTFGTF